MMFFTAKKANKISDREIKRYNRQDYREIKYKIKEAAKQGMTTITIDHNIDQKIKQKLEKKGFTIKQNEFFTITVSWSTAMTETKDS